MFFFSQIHDLKCFFSKNNDENIRVKSLLIIRQIDSFFILISKYIPFGTDNATTDLHLNYCTIRRISLYT